MSVAHSLNSVACRFPHLNRFLREPTIGIYSKISLLLSTKKASAAQAKLQKQPFDYFPRIISDPIKMKVVNFFVNVTLLLGFSLLSIPAQASFSEHRKESLTATGSSEPINSADARPLDKKKHVTLIVPGSSDSSKVRNPFVADLLQLIFDKQGSKLTIEYYPEPLLQGRALKELARGDLINLTWSATTIDRENALRAIRIPIYRGLIGWRVFLIHPEKQREFSLVTDQEQLASKIAVQRFDWPDYKVFKASGLQVEGDISYVKMSKALQDKLVDYFPRSIVEIERETRLARNSGLAIESELLIKYPSAYYFFVNANNQELAAELEQGFEKAITDGSYGQLFERYFSDILRELDLSTRTVIELPNPNVDIDKLPQDKKYWHR